MINLIQQISEMASTILAYVAQNGCSQSMAESVSTMMLEAGVNVNNDIQELSNVVFSNRGAGIRVISSKIDDPDILSMLSKFDPDTCPDAIIGEKEFPGYVCDFERMLARVSATKTLASCIDDINSGEFLRVHAAAIKMGEVQHKMMTIGVETADTISLGETLTQEDLEAIEKQSCRGSIKGTGTVFDYWMKIGRGELGVILAPPGVGKTTALVDIGAGYVEQNNGDGVVIHFSEELSKAAITQKYISRICGAQNPNIKQTLDRMHSLKSPIIIESHPTGTSTVSYLSGRVDKLSKSCSSTSGVAAIIVDYAAILTDSGDKSRFDSLSQIIIKLRQMACDFGCPVWTASQPQRNPARDTRTSVRVDNVSSNPVLGMSDVAECWAIPQVADYLVSLNQTDEERATNPPVVRVFPAKIRVPNKGVKSSSIKATKFTIDYESCVIA